MEFKQLEAFIHVVEQKSFSKAAKELYLTQPTISAHIASLESELNLLLIIRNTKGVKVSDSGEKLYVYAKEMLALREESILELMGGSGQKKILSLAASTIPSLYILPELMATYEKRSENHYFSIQKGDSFGVIKMVQNQQVEFGLVGTSITDSRLVFDPFFKDRLTLVTPNTSHFLKVMRQGNIWDVILKEPMILRESGSGTKKEAEKYLESKGICLSKLNVVANMNDQEAIKKSVSQGLGITIMSKKAVEDYEAFGKVLTADLSDETFTRNLYLVYLKNKRLSKQSKMFIEYIKDFYCM